MKRKYYILLLLLGFCVGTAFSQLDNPLEKQRQEQQRQEQQKEAQRQQEQQKDEERRQQEEKERIQMLNNYLIDANTLYESGKYKEALEKYNLYREASGTSISDQIKKAEECFNNLTLANSFFEKKEYKKASDFYNNILKINEKDINAINQIDLCKKNLLPNLPSYYKEIPNIPRGYSDYYSFSNGFAIIEIERNIDKLGMSKETKYGLLNYLGKEILPCKYDRINRRFSDNLCLIDSGGYWRFIDRDGNTAIYKDTQKDFSNGLLGVKSSEGWGFIDESGKEIIPCQYDEAKPFSEGLSLVYQDEKYFFIDVKGKVVLDVSQYRGAESFHDGLSKVYKNDKHGYIDITGKEVVPCVYDYIEFSDGLFFIGERKGFDHLENVIKWGLIDITGKIIIPYTYITLVPILHPPDRIGPYFVDGVAVVRKKDDWGSCGIINKTGDIVVPFKYNIFHSDIYSDISEGMIKVGDKNSKVGFYDINGNNVIPCKYDKNGAKNFHDGFAFVGLNGKGGFIDKAGKEITKLIYDLSWDFRGGDRYGTFNNGIAIVGLNRKYGLIDKAGKEIISCIYDDIIDSFDNGYSRVRLNDKLGVVNKTGKVVIPCEYNSIDFIESSFTKEPIAVSKDGKQFYINFQGDCVINCP